MDINLDIMHLGIESMIDDASFGEPKDAETRILIRP